MNKLFAIIACLSLVGCGDNFFNNTTEVIVRTVVPASVPQKSIADFATEKGLVITGVNNLTTCINLSSSQIDFFYKEMVSHSFQVGGQTLYWVARYIGNDSAFTFASPTPAVSYNQRRALTSDVVAKDYRAYILLGGEVIFQIIKFKSGDVSCPQGRVQSVDDSMKIDYCNTPGIGVPIATCLTNPW